MGIILSMSGRLRYHFHEVTSVLPAPILFLYFINACELGFPMTALGAWLNMDIHMSVANQSRFYAFTFLPWSFKPIYCWIVERYPIFGENRRPYIAICSLSAALLYLITASQVHDTWSAFVVTFVRQMFSAFSELLVGLMLVDLAHDDVSLTGKLQAYANSARIAGSGLAFLVALPLYGCGSSGSIVSVSPRMMIGFTALFPILAALGVSMLEPDFGKSRVKRLRSRVREEFIESQTTDIDESSSIETNETDHGETEDHREQPRVEVIPMIMGIFGVQWFMVWISLESFVGFTVWLSVLVTSLLIATGWAIFGMYRSLGTNFKSKTEFAGIVVAGGPLLFLFLLNATPTASTAWSTFQYYIFPNDLCRIQMLSLVSTVVGLIACWLYSKFADRVKPESFLIASLGLVGLSSFFQIPMVESWEETDPRLLGMQRGSYIFFVSSIGDLVGKLFFLSVQVYATQNCCKWPKESVKGTMTSGMMYGIYLSFINFGDSASGWITAPIVSALSIDFGSDSSDPSWNGLTTLIIIAAVSKFLVAAISLPLLSYARVVSGKHEVYDVVDEDGNSFLESVDDTGLQQESTLPEPLLA